MHPLHIELIASVTPLQIFGRSHVLLVHFPVALIIAAAIFEIIGILARRKGPTAAGAACLALGALSAIVTATSGWFHAEYNFHSNSSTLFYHRWLGIAAAALSLIVLALLPLAKRSAGGLRTYQLATIIAAVLVGIVGHLGGTLTHGPNFLFADESAASQPTTVAADTFNQIQPLMVKYCIDCHGPSKQKAGLRVDSMTALLTGGESGAAIVPGDAEHSLIMRRVLGLDDEPRMPYKKPPLPDEDVAKLRAWINSLPHAATKPAK